MEFDVTWVILIGPLTIRRNCRLRFDYLLKMSLKANAMQLLVQAKKLSGAFSIQSFLPFLDNVTLKPEIPST